MKITDSEIIKKSERDLMDSIIAELDWGNIEEVFKTHHKLNIEDDVEYKEGDIIVHNNQIAYQLNFEVKLNVSILCDRDGNYLSVTSSKDVQNEQKSEEEFPDTDLESDVIENPVEVLNDLPIEKVDVVDIKKEIDDSDWSESLDEAGISIDEDLDLSALSTQSDMSEK
ncbi:conserved hypothetical protein [Candidatus Magnetomoraceae bacterium gMMP-15]